MLNYLIKSFLNRFFKLEYNFTVDDPYYEQVPINPQKNRFKKTPRRLPDNLSANDERLLKKFKTRAHRYDMAFSFIGVPFGTATIFQLVPVAGTIYTTYNSLQLLWLTRSFTNGFPIDLFLMCLLNILVDLLIGLIPIVGDLINIGFKANSRNYAIVRRHLFQISDYNNGIISKAAIRSNFVNNRFNWFKENEPVELKSLAAPLSITDP
ncbi:hypothetical protein PSN45_000114 [Yamadazyma tenuis]|uniref:uncharacterized protein n=1 Tax=Candida tenuis TaxID=2315449 RepID=UPI0027A1F115|nr:hypothetical protein PSN45_000114 [Yamadazyma tenuis]